MELLDYTVLGAAAVTAAGLLWRKLLRPFIRAIAWWDRHGRRLLEHVHSELSPNSGQSTRDVVERIDRTLSAHIADSCAHGRCEHGGVA